MTWLIGLIVGLFKAWLGKADPVAVEAQQLGETQEALKGAQTDAKAVSDAHAASNAADRAAVADPSSLRAPSPDSRD